MTQKVVGMALSEVLKDALAESADAGDERTVYLLSAIAFRQLGIIFPPPSDATPAESLALAIVEAEQERFLARVMKKRQYQQVWIDGKSNRNRIEIESKSKGCLPQSHSQSQSHSHSEGGRGAQVRPRPQDEKAVDGKGGFSPPSVDEVREFADGAGISIDAEHFVNHYAAQGWKISNGLPMKDWRAAVSSWHRRDASQQSKGGGWAKPPLSTINGDATKGGRFDGLF